PGPSNSLRIHRQDSKRRILWIPPEKLVKGRRHFLSRTPQSCFRDISRKPTRAASYSLSKSGLPDQSNQISCLPCKRHWARPAVRRLTCDRAGRKQWFLYPNAEAAIPIPKRRIEKHR